jgi:hypothetical protein
MGPMTCIRDDLNIFERSATGDPLDGNFCPISLQHEMIPICLVSIRNWHGDWEVWNASGSI